MLFSFDVIDLGLGFWETVGAWFMHSIPSIVLIIMIVLAWKWEWIGALAFLGVAVWYVLMTRGMQGSVNLVISVIPFILGLLFLTGWIWRKQIRSDLQSES
jgi:hypothetical protein